MADERLANTPEGLSPDAYDMAIRVPLDAPLCQRIIDVFSGDVAGASRWVDAALQLSRVGGGDVLGDGLLLLERAERSAIVLGNHKRMAELLGARSIGFGIPYQQEVIDHEQALVLKRRLDEIATVKPYLGPFTMPSLPGRQQRRSLTERKVRRAKRKQRRQR